MHFSHLLSPIDAFISRSAFFVLRLPAQSILRLIDEAASPTTVFITDIYIKVDIWPLVYFSFIRCSPTHCIFSFAEFSAVSDLASLKKLALEGPFNVYFCASCLSYSARSPRGSPILFLGSFLLFGHLNGFWQALACPFITYLTVILQSSRKDCLSTASYVPGSFVPALCFYHILTNKVSLDIFLDIWQDYFDSCLSSFYVSRRK